MELKQNILEAIGNTPLVKINKLTRSIKGELYAKCEFMNPGGSIKDRIGNYIIEKAEKAGTIQPGGTVIEATSGNTGMGLAITAAIRGYKTIFVMPDKMSEEKRQNLRAFGAKVVITPTVVPPESPESYYSVAKRLVDETPNSFYANQYHNLDNRETHYYTTGPEIWRQTEGKFDAIVIGMGTCGTISGIGKYLKEKNPNIKVIGVDPKGSILKDLFETGKMVEAQGYLIEGIGEDIVPSNCDFSVIDEIVRVEDKESFVMTRNLLTREGIFSGVSSGSAVVGALRYMSQTQNPGRVLVILPDSGNRYLSKVYNDAWMIENSFLEKRIKRTIAELIEAVQLNNSKLIKAEPNHKVDDIVQKMRSEGVSQVPVFQGDKIIGVISETDLLRPLFARTVSPEDKIESLIDQNYAMVEDTDPIERLNDVFTGGKTAIVSVSGKAKHIVTQIDLISFLSICRGRDNEEN